MAMSQAASKKRKRIPPAGILCAKTLAEENLKGFRLKNVSKENDLSMRTNCPQRIELPIYFNTPKRQEDIFSAQKLRTKAKQTSALNMGY
jgi:hypothetical protein